MSQSSFSTSTLLQQLTSNFTNINNSNIFIQTYPFKTTTPQIQPQMETRNATDIISEILVNLDNQARGIILLTTAFVTMLLSTCFLLFIIYFCCYISSRTKPSTSYRNTSRIHYPSKNNENNIDTSHKTHIAVDSPLKRIQTNTLVEDYTDIKLDDEEKESVLAVAGLEMNQAVNSAFTPDSDAPQANNNKTDNFSFIRNLPQLTASQIEKDFAAHTLNCRKRYEQLLVSSVGYNKEKQLNRLLVNSGRKSFVKRGRVLEVRAEFGQSGVGKDKCDVSRVEVFEMKPRRADPELVWRI